MDSIKTKLCDHFNYFGRYVFSSFHFVRAIPCEKAGIFEWNVSQKVWGGPSNNFKMCVSRGERCPTPTVTEIEVN